MQWVILPGILERPKGRFRARKIESTEMVIFVLRNRVIG
jgi:hypothetical protein